MTTKIAKDPERGLSRLERLQRSLGRAANNRALLEDGRCLNSRMGGERLTDPTRIPATTRIRIYRINLLCNWLEAEIDKELANNE